MYYDDVFDKYGNYLKPIKGSNLVKIEIGGKQYRLSQLDYNSIGTRKACCKILVYYATKLGYTGTFGVKEMEKDHTGAHTTRWGTVFFNIKKLKTGRLDNYYNIMSVLQH